MPYVHLVSPGAKQAWPTSAACWSPSAARDRHPRQARPRTCRRPRRCRGSPGASARGMSKISSSLSDQRQRREVHEHGAAGVGDVGDVPPPLRPPVRFQISQDSIVPKRASPRHGRGAQPGDLVEQPAQPRRGEVAGHRQPGDRGDLRRGVREVGDDACGAGVLPGDRVGERATGVPVPDDRGLPLVGDADRDDVRGREACGAQRLGDHPQHVAPDLRGVVLDVARRGWNCRCSSWPTPRHAAGVVEQEAAGGARALVDRGDHPFRHVDRPWPMAPAAASSSSASRGRSAAARSEAAPRWGRGCRCAPTTSPPYPPDRRRRTAPCRSSYSPTRGRPPALSRHRQMLGRAPPSSVQVLPGPRRQCQLAERGRRRRRERQQALAHRGGVQRQRPARCGPAAATRRAGRRGARARTASVVGGRRAPPRTPVLPASASAQFIAAARRSCRSTPRCRCRRPAPSRYRADSAILVDEADARSVRDDAVRGGPRQVEDRGELVQRRGPDRRRRAGAGPRRPARSTGSVPGTDRPYVATCVRQCRTSARCPRSRRFLAS